MSGQKKMRAVIETTLSGRNVIETLVKCMIDTKLVRVEEVEEYPHFRNGDRIVLEDGLAYTITRVIDKPAPPAPGPPKQFLGCKHHLIDYGRNHMEELTGRVFSTVMCDKCGEWFEMDVWRPI